MTQAARKARAAHALRSLPGVAAAGAARSAPADNALVRAGLARATADGFELTEKGATFLSRAGS